MINGAARATSTDSAEMEDDVKQKVRQQRKTKAVELKMMMLMAKILLAAAVDAAARFAF